MSTDAPTEVPRQTRDSGAASDAMAAAVRDMLDSSKSKQDTLSTLNRSLEGTHVLPGLTITGINDVPGNIEDVTLSGPGANGPAKYDQDSHVLTYERPAVLPGHGDAPESVSINMVTGEETVTTKDKNGNTRTTTREYVNSPSTMTTVSDPQGRVLQTEATNNSGATTVRQFTYNPDGSMTVRTQPNAVNGAMTADAERVDVPAGQQPKVDPKTGVLAYKSEDGSTHALTPEGREFTFDKNGNTTYVARPNDNLWDVSRDLLRVQPKDNKPNPNPSEQDIQTMANSLSKLYPNGIRAGENLNLANVGLANLPSALGATEQAGPPNSTYDAEHKRWVWKPEQNSAPITLPEDIKLDDPNRRPHIDERTHQMVYTNTSGHEVRVSPNGEEVTDVNGTKIYRHGAGQKPFRIEIGQGGNMTVLEPTADGWKTGTHNYEGGELLISNVDGKVQYKFGSSGARLVINNVWVPDPIVDHDRIRVN